MGETFSTTSQAFPERRDAAAVDLNTILAWLNVLIVAATVGVFAGVGPGDYIDGSTIILAVVLGVQTQIVLMVERRRRDPFVIVVAFILILYYSLRVLTILLFQFSFVFDRFAYTPSDSNTALVFIILANCFLFSGLYLVRGNSSLRVDVEGWRPAAPVRSIVFVALVVAMIYSRGALWDPNSLPRALQVVFVFTSESIIVLMAIAYYVVFRRKMSRAESLGLLALLVLEMILHTLAGSRSAFVYALQNVMLIVLAVRGCIVVQRKHVVVGLVSLPVTVGLLVAAFTISTVVTTAHAGGVPLGLSKALSLSSEAGVKVDRDYALKVGLPVIFARAGFFDFSAEIIAHRRQYAAVINPSAYFRSIIDNLLTPGYDLFDQPKIANALIFVYAERGTVSKAATTEAYQSDQLGIYGELFVLFGYASLPLFFIGAYLIKRAYFGMRNKNPFMLAMMRVATLAIFAEIMNSFGLDWVLADLVPLAAGIYIYRVFFAAARTGEADKSDVLATEF